MTTVQRKDGIALQSIDPATPRRPANARRRGYAGSMLARSGGPRMGYGWDGGIDRWYKMRGQS